MQRVVRLGRPANDNARKSGLATRLLAASLAAALAAYTIYDWWL